MCSVSDLLGYYNPVTSSSVRGRSIEILYSSEDDKSLLLSVAKVAQQYHQF
jgi:hypothetical protein